MADCNDVTKALNALSAKIDKLNQCCEQNKNKIADLDKRLKNLEKGNSPNNKNQSQNLNDIYKRLARLEQYCLSIESLFNQIGAIIKPIISIFK